ncbi:MAG TPA: hypothetical protein VFW96_16665 [Thermomicrobiales bacterium]|nr:hypothetical protein [Thermomicrobiales bacterium]
MATLTLELPPDLYERLRAEAERQGKPAADVAQEWLAERLPAPPPAPAPAGDREQVRAILRAAGLLVEPTPEERARAAAVTVTLEEVRAALDRAGGRPLSEIILEMRGPKE